MSQLYLVRHGQASFGATDYDQLSTLGYQQSKWLGEHFRDLDIVFSRVITGTLKRQLQTAETILAAAAQSVQINTHQGFNEFDFHALATVYCHSAGESLPGTEDGGKLFFQMLRRAMQAWARDELHTARDSAHPAVLESWQEFHDRVKAGLLQLQASEQEENVLVVSSGGAMAMALAQILGCGVDTLINLNMQTRNTGIHHFHFNQRSFQLAAFNALPHLQQKNRLHALTYS